MLTSGRTLPESPKARSSSSGSTGEGGWRMDYAVRRARTSDVRAIRALVDANSRSGHLLDKPTVALYEDVQEFWVASAPDGEIAGCGALHVMWEDLAEIRTLAVAADHQARGIGNQIVLALLDSARELGVSRVFVLTFAVELLPPPWLYRDFRPGRKPSGLCGAAALLRRGRRRVPRSRPGEAQHAGQYAHAVAHAVSASPPGLGIGRADSVASQPASPGRRPGQRRRPG